jgi:oligopeptidase B
VTTIDIHPPTAARRPVQRTIHGDTVTDEYSWLSDRDDPDTIAYLQAENAYTDAKVAHLAGLRKTLFAEIKARTLETDLSLPARQGDFWYYTRTVEGLQYGIHCRVPVTPGEDAPPAIEAGAALDREDVLLDVNALAEGHDFVALGTFDVSPDGRWLAYSVDHAGDERYTVRIKNLVTGELLPDAIVDVHEGSAWAADASVLFYVRANDAWRPYQIWRHVIGTPAADDDLVYHETDERFFVSVELTRSDRFVLIGAASQTTSDYRFIPAATPLAEPILIAPRRDGVEYHVSHQGDRFLILHNLDALDYALSETPVDAPGEWTTVLAHQPGLRLLDVDPFAGHLVVSLRHDGLTGLRVMRNGGAAYDITFPDPIYTVMPSSNHMYETNTYRLTYTSMVTPDSIYDCDVASGELTLRKSRPIQPDPSGRPFHPADYEQHREWAVASDGTRVPISLMCRRGTPRDGSAALVLYGYGAYEASIDPYFSVARLSLADRGVVFAIAHVRGGGEMGRRWYDEGKLFAKRNTFTDFIASAQHLAASGWTTTERIVARGGSAGGLLVGAALEIEPEAFGAVVAVVPFVDALNTMLDPTLPLTITEWEEWGDPLHHADFYQYMRGYSPYENVADRNYPPLLVLGSLNDTRVSYAEPTKWVARLRALSPQTPVLLKTEMGAGHGGPSGRYNSWREEALINAWTLDRVGLA